MNQKMLQKISADNYGKLQTKQKNLEDMKLQFILILFNVFLALNENKPH